MNCSMMLKDVLWFLNPIKIIQIHSNTLDFEGSFLVNWYWYSIRYLINVSSWQEEHGHLEGKLRVKEAAAIGLRCASSFCAAWVKWSEGKVHDHLDGSSKQWKHVHFSNSTYTDTQFWVKMMLFQIFATYNMDICFPAHGLVVPFANDLSISWNYCKLECMVPDGCWATYTCSSCLWWNQK